MGGRSAKEGCRGRGGGQSAAFLGEVLTSILALPSRSRREEGARAGGCSRSPVPSYPSQSGASAPDPLTKDWSRCPGRQQDSYLSPAARAVRALLCLSSLSLALGPGCKAPLEGRRGCVESGGPLSSSAPASVPGAVSFRQGCRDGSDSAGCSPPAVLQICRTKAKGWLFATLRLGVWKEEERKAPL